MKNKTNSLLMALALSAAFVAPCSAQTDCQAALLTDSVSLNVQGSRAECKVFVEYPKIGGNPLSEAVGAYINAAIGAQNESGSASLATLVGKFGVASFDEMTKEAEQLAREMPPFNGQYYQYLGIRKVYEGVKFVTFATTASTYMGGAHPSSSYSGVTFTKADGSKVGYDIFKDTGSKEFRAVVTDGLKKYFNVKTDKDLKNCLIDVDNVKKIPLPKSAPMFTERGIELVYGQYEIAPYAAGMPTVVIPYESAKPLLKKASDLF